MVISETGGEISGYGNSLPFVLSVCLSPEWWMDSSANIHVCADVFLFTSYQADETGALLMENGFTCACSWCWYGCSEVYFRKDGAIKERAACLLHQEESC